MEKKIQKLRLAPIFEGKAIYENEGGSKIIAVSIGAGIELKKAEGASALVIDSIASSTVRYNKVEEKDLELEVLQNELAGVVGDFDNNVHKLLQKYGYEWVNPADTEATPADHVVTEAVNEGGSDDPTGTWIGNFLVTKAFNISAIVDEIADQYDFGGDQKMEDKFRSVVASLLKEEDGSELASALIDDDYDMQEIAHNWLSARETELAEFDDYK